MQHTQKKIEWDTLSSEEKSNENPKKKMQENKSCFLEKNSFIML